MANTVIQLKHSTLTGNVPSSLANGEISINSRDGKFFYSTPAGVVVTHYPYPGPAGLNQEVQFNDSGVLGSDSGLTYNKTTDVLTVVGGAIVGGVNVTPQIQLAFTQANTPSHVANSAASYANSAFSTANSAGGAAAAASSYANSAFGKANTAAVAANTPSHVANSAASYANSAFARANNSLDANNGGTVTGTITATSFITTGSFGNILGANVIYSNVFVANSGGITTTGNSTLNGIVTVSYVAGAGNQNAAMEMIGANTKGGTGYFDFISANNNSAGTTNKNKYFRIDSNGKLQIINSAYTQNIFDLNDSGYLTVPGGIATSQYIQFSDGSKQFTANAGSGGGSTDFGFGIIYTANNNTFANATTANAQVNFVGENGTVVFANATTKTITFAGTPGLQGLTVDYGFVNDPVFYSIDYGSLA